MVKGSSLPAGDVAALQATAAAVDAEPEDEAADDMEGPAGGPVTTKDIVTQATLRYDSVCGIGRVNSHDMYVDRLGGGIAMCAVFSDPLVEALTTLSSQTGVPPFAVGFVLTPLASNASEVLSSLEFAAKKRVKNISLTFSQVRVSLLLRSPF